MKTNILPDEECYVLDILSITRTHLSNERTFLAYLRTFLGFLTAGAALIKFVADTTFLIFGYVLLFFSAIILVIGIYRFINVRQIIITKICVQNEHKYNTGKTKC